MAMTKDAQLIAHLGGPAKVAELLGLDKQGGTQRVQNWIARGIPYRVRVEHPKIFKKINLPKVDLPAPQSQATQGA